MAEKKIDTRTEVEIKLDFPFDFDGATVDSLTMRRPKVRDSLKAKKAKGDDMERGLALIADLCDVPPEVLLELDEVDLEKVQGQYLAFTGRSATDES